MIITFFGHTDFPAEEKSRTAVISVLEERVGNENVEFYLGGYGNFDSFALSCCKEYKKNHENASLVFVTPYITEEYQKNHLSEISKNFDSVIYPEIEQVPLRFAISYRNRYMVDSADLIICYVKREYGGAYQAIKYARKKGKQIINLAEKLL